MGSPLASYDDVSDLWSDYDSSQNDRIDRLIEKASGLLRRALPAVDQRIELFDTLPDDRLALDPDVVATVVATIVKRFLDNPTGALNRSITEGPYAESIGYGERVGGAYVQRGTLVVTDADLAQLLPDPETIVGGSIRLGIVNEPGSEFAIPVRIHGSRHSW